MEPHPLVGFAITAVVYSLIMFALDGMKKADLAEAAFNAITALIVASVVTVWMFV